MKIGHSILRSVKNGNDSGEPMFAKKVADENKGKWSYTTTHSHIKELVKEGMLREEYATANGCNYKYLYITELGENMLADLDSPQRPEGNTHFDDKPQHEYIKESDSNNKTYQESIRVTHTGAPQVWNFNFNFNMDSSNGPRMK